MDKCDAEGNGKNPQFFLEAFLKLIKRCKKCINIFVASIEKINLCLILNV